ncbi:hypothetical protein [Marinagarivorans cellulosilyticus]|uniref:Uncharacterized protein n=1 Tax=Marinagarivorans cellulosilyticus TaxID=2721545 RepID=A0AAN1WKE5_9GAMM|nr:hypothetical protein [Marinagarivorans cellulosilyticus]BCD99238.1 hypothetical protein MARGE09_P3439 [Marinagarivorans cellulosilyticus]
MKLLKHTVLNARYFATGSRPAKKAWRDAVERSAINGLILDGIVYIDEDEFLSRQDLDKNLAEKEVTPNFEFIDLLA